MPSSDGSELKLILEEIKMLTKFRANWGQKGHFLFGIYFVEYGFLSKIFNWR